MNTEIEPIDIAVVTAPYNDPQILKNFNTIMGDRWAWMLPKHKDAKRPPRQHITNNHLWATNKIINSKIIRLKEGQQILLRGHLIRVTYPNGAQSTSSQTRDDEGYAPIWSRGTPRIARGSCEIILVESIKIKREKDSILFD